MTKLGYLLAAAAAIAIASPAFAQDAPKAGAGVSINQGATSGAEVKRDAGRSQEGRGEVRGEHREGMRGEIRGERREGFRGEVRGERRVARTGINVMIGERERYRERRWHRARAERVVIIKHRHHRYHRHYGHHRHHHGM